MCELKKNVWKICAGSTSKMLDFHAKCVKLGRSAWYTEILAKLNSCLLDLVNAIIMDLIIVLV